jgi:hypothetical protein
LPGAASNRHTTQPILDPDGHGATSSDWCHLGGEAILASACKTSPVEVHERHMFLSARRRPVNIAIEVGIAASTNHEILFDPYSRIGGLCRDRPKTRKECPIAAAPLIPKNVRRCIGRLLAMGGFY